MSVHSCGPKCQRPLCVLQAKVEELKKELAKKPDDEDFRIQSRHYEQHIEELQAKVDELKQERNLAWGKGYTRGRDDAHQTIVALQAKVEELEDFVDRVASDDSRDNYWLEDAIEALKQESKEW